MSPVFVDVTVSHTQCGWTFFGLIFVLAFRTLSMCMSTTTWNRGQSVICIASLYLSNIGILLLSSSLANWWLILKQSSIPIASKLVSAYSFTFAYQILVVKGESEQAGDCLYIYNTLIIMNIPVPALEWVRRCVRTHLWHPPCQAVISWKSTRPGTSIQSWRCRSTQGWNFGTRLHTGISRAPNVSHNEINTRWAINYSNRSLRQHSYQVLFVGDMDQN